MAAQGIESCVPERLVTSDPAGRLSQTLRGDDATDDAPLLLADDKARVFEHAQVLHEAGKRHAVRRGQLADAVCAATERNECVASNGVCQRAEHGVQIDVPMLNHRVKYRNR
jgi:hypothetical protein